MAITGWNGENSGTPVHVRDVGSSDNGSETADVVTNITDNGSYYTFNGTDSLLRWNGDLAGEDTLEYKVRFRVHNNSKNDVQVIWKSGGNTNGAALGIDASNNLGFFGRVSDTLTSLTFNNTEYDNNVWYILYAKGSEIALYNTETEGCIVKTGTVNRGDGSGNEAMGASDHELTGNKTSVISTTIADDPAGFFDGDIDFVAGYSTGQLDFPEEAAVPGEDIEGVGGGYGITVNLDQESKLIIMNDDDSTIEWRKTVTSGTTETKGLTETSKIVVAREITSGESYGYGGVVPVQLVPNIPFVETWDGDYGTQPDRDLWVPLNGVENYMGLDGTGLLTDLSNMGGLGDSFFYQFAYRIDGEFEIECRFYSDGTKGSDVYGSNYARLRVRDDNNKYVEIGTISTSNSYNWKQAIENIDGWNSDNDVLLNTSDYLSWYKVWRTASGYIRMAWKDEGRDAPNYQWDGAAYYETSVPMPGRVAAFLHMHPRGGSATYRIDHHEFRINAGTLEPV